MLDGITTWAEALMGMPWIYLIIIGTAVVDSFLPLIPSESLIIAGGAFAATQNEPNLWLLVLAGACGAWIGDMQWARDSASIFVLMNEGTFATGAHMFEMPVVRVNAATGAATFSFVNGMTPVSTADVTM